MARKATTVQKVRPAELTAEQITRGIEKIRRRIDELEQLLNCNMLDRLDREAPNLSKKIEETLSQIFGADTEEYQRYKVQGLYARGHYMDERFEERSEYVEQHHVGVQNAIAVLNTTISMLVERLDDIGASPGGKARRAIDGLDLHRDIEEAAGQLYRDGHYSNAVLEAAKALTALVQYRSGYTQDGADLMNNVFSVGKPILRFNDLVDESDRNEQKGFHVAVLGRRHGTAQSAGAQDHRGRSGGSRRVHRLHQFAGEACR